MEILFECYLRQKRLLRSWKKNFLLSRQFTQMKQHSNKLVGVIFDHFLGGIRAFPKKEKDLFNKKLSGWEKKVFYLFLKRKREEKEKKVAFSSKKSWFPFLGCVPFFPSLSLFLLVGERAMETYTNEKHGFTLQYPMGWVKESEDMDTTEVEVEGVLQQLRIIAMHPAIESQEDFEEKYEEVMVMKQVCFLSLSLLFQIIFLFPYLTLVLCY